jgi:hypothetical protein
MSGEALALKGIPNAVCGERARPPSRVAGLASILILVLDDERAAEPHTTIVARRAHILQFAKVESDLVSRPEEQSMHERAVVLYVDFLVEDAGIPVTCGASQRFDAMLPEHRTSIGQSDGLVTCLQVPAMSVRRSSDADGFHRTDSMRASWSETPRQSRVIDGGSREAISARRASYA